MDEVAFFEIIQNLKSNGIPTFCEICIDEHGQVMRIFNYHPPLYIAYLTATTTLFQLSTYVLRFSNVIFSIATVVLTYFVGVELSGKKLGLLSSFLLSINRLHVEHSQIIDIDGSFLTFFIFLSILFLLKWFKSFKTKYFIFSVFTITLSILTKESSILIFLPLFVYLYRKQKFNYFLKMAALVFSMSMILIILFSYFYSTDFFNGPIQQMVNGLILSRVSTDKFLRLYQFIGITTWDFTPPFLLLSILSIFYGWKNRVGLKFLIYFVLFFAGSFIVILGITRYLVPIVPILCVLIANFMLNLKIKSKKIALFVVSLTALFCLTTFYSLKIRNDYLFLSDVKSNFQLIIVPYLLILFPLVLYPTKYKKFGLIVAFGMLIGYNLYFAQESVNPIITPDYNKAVLYASEFIKKSSLRDPLISMHDISFYSNANFYFIEGPYAINVMKNMFEQNKTFYAVYTTNSVVIQPNAIKFLENNCTKIGNGFSRNVEVFKAFKC
jgi:4-amino-4-deoxy-L-arabinose transferase-like glycosyltransferase